MASTAAQKPHVLILGAGLGGLTLAQSLRKQGIPYSIFERDESMHSRPQGWAIAVHTILDDIEKSFPSDLPSIDRTSHLLPLTLPAQLCFYTGDRRFYVESDSEHKILRCNRQKLREWLATGLDINWNAHVTAIKEADSAVTLSFADGSSVSGDILVGADGVHSIVRSHILPDTKLTPVPVSCIIGEPTISGEAFQRQLGLAHSCYASIGPGFHTFIGVNRVADDAQSAKYYWYFIEADENPADPNNWRRKASQQELLDYVLEKTGVLDGKYTESLRLTKPEEMKTPPINFSEVEIEKLPKGRITLLGDAAHSMTPFRGEGGVHAMRDALELTRVVAGISGTNVADPLKEYETEMLPRGLEALRKSRAANANRSADQGARIAWGRTVQMA